MMEIELNGNTLGEKHLHYNLLLKEAIKGNLNPEPIDISHGDIRNLIKIDLACVTKNVDYILEVFKLEDMLYVSKAIKRSTWLITEEQYAHIMNPGYLQNHLFPQMTAKAINKLMLSIRLNLKDESRVEDFFKYVEYKNPKSAFNWLHFCSLSFIENIVKKYIDDIPIPLVVRLCKRSVSIVEIYGLSNTWRFRELIKNTLFLLRDHTEKILDILDSKDHYEIPKLNAKMTDLIMLKCPNRVIDQFPKYAYLINLPAFVKHLKKEEILSFLLKYKKHKDLNSYFTYEKLKHFIKRMPKEERFPFIKSVFINKEKYNKDEAHESVAEILCSDETFYKCFDSTNIYEWYRFAPFEIAFTDLKKMIRTESNPAVRTSMLIVLLDTAGRNVQHIQALLQYFYEKHINEPFKFKIHFMNILLSRMNTHKFDDKTWDILNQLFCSMEAYVKSENNVDNCIKAIIVRKVLEKENIPDIIETKFQFNSLKNFQPKLNSDEKNAIFTYLYHNLLIKLEKQAINSEATLNKTSEIIKDIMQLLKDWNKNLSDYPNILEKIKELIEIAKEHSWPINLSSLYNLNKKWRKDMFEQSLILYGSEDACLNVLKHKPDLFDYFESEMKTIRYNDTISLNRLHSKIRIYWPKSLANTWANDYLKRLDDESNHKSLITGLCVLLPTPLLTDILKKYAPGETKIKWNETDETLLSLRKQIAQHMHIARPLISLETVLWYAKGDYLQYTGPSLKAVLNDISNVKCAHYVPILLKEPVSVQKYGIRVAFTKLKSAEIKPLFYEIWRTTKNMSIRSVLFTSTFSLLCKENNSTLIDEIWDLLSMFIDNLTPDENSTIYTTLGKADLVPLSVRPKFITKSYSFLLTLPAKAKCENEICALERHSTAVMKQLDGEFVVNVVLKKLLDGFPDRKYEITNVLVAYFLCSDNEEMQFQRYLYTLSPLVERSLLSYNEICEGEYRNLSNIQDFLKTFPQELKKYIFAPEICIIPVKLFEDILIKFETTLPVLKNYEFITSWKLVVAFLKVVDDNKWMLNDLKVELISNSYTDESDKWDKVNSKLIPLFGKACLQILKDDIKRLYPSVYVLFANALQNIFDSFLSNLFLRKIQLDLLKYILDDEVIESYLVVYILTPQNVYSDDDAIKLKELRKVLFINPSTELKLHYYQNFGHKPDMDIEEN